MSGRKTWCKHYQAMSSNEQCKAGVSYDTMKGMPFNERPCFEVLPEKCKHACYRTAEEIAAEKKVMDQRFADTCLARTAIVSAIGEYKKGKSPGSSGTIDCPVCGSKDSLRFSRAAYNGHIHAACDTEGCVRWME